MTAEIVPVEESHIVHPAVTADEARRWMERYQELCRALLDANDTVEIRQGNTVRQFKKKSAWRKLALAFHVSDEVIDHHIERDERGRPIYAAFTVRATAQTARGPRTAVGYHEAHATERCCPAARGEPCPNARREGHACCPNGCDGTRHWAHPGDLPALAHTRAKNRAIADLIGAGEVSAEEIGAVGNGEERRRNVRNRQPRRASSEASEPHSEIEAAQEATEEAPPQQQQQQPPRDERLERPAIQTALMTFWETAREQGFSRASALEQFGLDPREGAEGLLRYARQRAAQTGRTVAQVINDMTAALEGR